MSRQKSKPRSEARKPKLVRDSFTIPKSEYAAVETLKSRAVALGGSVKKSELLRAGLKLLSGLNDAAYLDALAAIPTLKTGRPRIEKTPASEAPKAASKVPSKQPASKPVVRKTARSKAPAAPRSASQAKATTPLATPRPAPRKPAPATQRSTARPAAAPRKTAVRKTAAPSAAS